jgi:transcription antitermination factor NusG
MLTMSSEQNSMIVKGPWHALHTRHQHEKKISELLHNKGFETFLPLYSAVRQWKDRTKLLSLPLFPCYVFIRGGLDRKLQIIQTPGVHGIVETAGLPGVIPEIEIQAIQRAVESSLKMEPHPFLECGDLVRITSGPMSGLEGILIRKRDQLRLVLSVEMLGRSVAVEVGASVAERISKARDSGSPFRNISPAPSPLGQSVLRMQS